MENNNTPKRVEENIFEIQKYFQSPLQRVEMIKDEDYDSPAISVNTFMNLRQNVYYSEN